MSHSPDAQPTEGHITISLEDLHTLALAARWAISYPFPSPDPDSSHQRGWLAEEFFVYVNRTQAQVLELLEQFAPALDAWKEREFAKAQEARAAAHEKEWGPTQDD